MAEQLSVTSNTVSTVVLGNNLKIISATLAKETVDTGNTSQTHIRRTGKPLAIGADGRLYGYGLANTSGLYILAEDNNSHDTKGTAVDKTCVVAMSGNINSTLVATVVTWASISSAAMAKNLGLNFYTAPLHFPAA